MIHLPNLPSMVPTHPMLHLKNKLRLLPLLQLLLKKLQITLKQLLKKLLLPLRRLRKDIKMLFYLLKKLLIMPIMLLTV